MVATTDDREALIARLVKRSSRTFKQWLKRWQRDVADASRFGLVQSAAVSCREGKGWLTDCKVLFRVHPEDRPAVAALAEPNFEGRILTDQMQDAMVGRDADRRTAEYPGTPTRYRLTDGEKWVAGAHPGEFGDFEIDTLYTGFLARYFPGFTLAVPEPKQEVYLGKVYRTYPAIRIAWKGEVVGVVMPLVRDD